MVDILFYILNISILIFVAIFVFKRFFMRSIYAKIEQENNYIVSLEEEHTAVITTQKATDQALIFQQELCQQLMLKVDQWKIIVEETTRQKEQIYKERLQESNKRLEQQSAYSALKYQRQQVAPEVIKELEKSLIDYFQDNRHVRNYIDRIIINRPKGNT